MDRAAVIVKLDSAALYLLGPVLLFVPWAAVGIIVKGEKGIFLLSCICLNSTESEPLKD